MRIFDEQIFCFCYVLTFHQFCWRFVSNVKISKKLGSRANSSALCSIKYLAISGFIFSHKIVEKPTNDDKNESIRSRDVSLTLSIASHLVVGGLLTIQIQNTWDAYDLQFMTVGVFLSLSWMIYALLIFTWGAYSNQKIFRILGSLVIGITSLKVFFLDLTKPSTIYIVMLLLIIGVIILTIARIDKFWREKHGTDGIKAKEKKIWE